MFDLTGKKFVFIGGLHRSGTSILHSILRDHPQISGFQNTGAPQDEGQHLQTVFKPAKSYGGRGMFGFFPMAHLNETSSLASVENAEILLEQWGGYWDFKKTVLIEKSPPNIVRTRFLQKLFPNAYFIIIIRHPIAVTMASLKTMRSKMRLSLVIKHWLICHKKFEFDKAFLRNSIIVRYEDLISNPDPVLNDIYKFIGVESTKLIQEIRPGINQKYFGDWYDISNKFPYRYFIQYSIEKYEEDIRKFGYTFYV